MTYVSRAEWGSIDTKPAQLHGALGELYVHHVAGRLPKSVADEYKHMRELQSYAINTKHYQDIDYNLIVGPSGTIYEARGMLARSAATLDRNTVSRAICAMGNYQTDVPTQALLDGIVAAAFMLNDIGATTGDVIVRGHQDNPAHPKATACPGTNLYARVPELAALIKGESHTAPPAPLIIKDRDAMQIIGNSQVGKYGNIAHPNGGCTLWAMMPNGTKRLLGFGEWLAGGGDIGRGVDNNTLDIIPNYSAAAAGDGAPTSGTWKET